MLRLPAHLVADVTPLQFLRMFPLAIEATVTLFPIQRDSNISSAEDDAMTGDIDLKLTFASDAEASTSCSAGFLAKGRFFTFSITSNTKNELELTPSTLRIQLPHDFDGQVSPADILDIITPLNEATMPASISVRVSRFAQKVVAVPMMLSSPSPPVDIHTTASISFEPTAQHKFSEAYTKLRGAVVTLRGVDAVLVDVEQCKLTAMIPTDLTHRIPASVLCRAVSKLFPMHAVLDVRVDGSSSGGGGCGGDVAAEDESKLNVGSDNVSARTEMQQPATDSENYSTPITATPSSKHSTGRGGGGDVSGGENLSFESASHTATTTTTNAAAAKVRRDAMRVIITFSDEATAARWTMRTVQFGRHSITLSPY